MKNIIALLALSAFAASCGDNSAETMPSDSTAESATADTMSDEVESTARSANDEPTVAATEPSAGTSGSADASDDSAANSSVAAKSSRCAISAAVEGSPGKGNTYEGPCLFSREEGSSGSFSVTRANGTAFFTTEAGPITEISVGIQGDRAQFTALTPDSIQRWGFGRRLADKACWGTGEVTVCAY